MTRAIHVLEKELLDSVSTCCIASNSTINNCSLHDSLVVDVWMTPCILLLHDFSQRVYLSCQRVGLISCIEKWESEQETWMSFVFPQIYWTWHVKFANPVLFFWYNEGKHAAVEILNWGTRVRIVLEAAQGMVYSQLDILWANLAYVLSYFQLESFLLYVQAWIICTMDAAHQSFTGMWRAATFSWVEICKLK